MSCFFSSHTFIFKSGGLDQAIKVSGHVYACRGIDCASFYDFLLDFKSVFTPDETHVNKFLPLMKHILISIYP